MLKYFSLILLSYFLGRFFTRRVIKLAVKHNAVDKPTHRKVHRSIIPLWGGVAIYLSFFLTIFLFFLFNSSLLWENSSFLGKRLYGLFLGSTVLVIFGVIDDKCGIPPKLKLMGQILATVIVIFFGVRILGVHLPLFNRYVSFSVILSVLVTLIWIVSIINSFNFIDGLDGLAAGIAFIAALTFFAIAYFKPPLDGPLFAYNVSSFVCVIAIVLMGSTLAFLRFNFAPAKIFMGDCGSQFLGLILASLSVIGSFKGITSFTVFTPMLILTIPIFDIIYAVVRRIRKQVPVSKADKSHLHHRLLVLGLAPKQAVIILYIISIIFSSLAVMLS